MIPVGPFLLSEPIGQGGMASVWGAVHAREGAPAAVKILTGEAILNPVYLALFRNEVRGVAALDHPHIIRVFDHGLLSAQAAAASEGQLVAGSPWLAMERLDGGTLADLARDGITWGQLRDGLVATLNGLAHAHARGVVHRDIKPGNVLLGRQGEIKLTDFGLVHAIEGTEGIGDSLMLGTPAYMAPEQLQMRARDYGPWTDLYAVGCMGWTLATGFPPFGRELKEALYGHLHSPPPPFRPDLELPADFERWLRWLLTKDVDSRVSRAAEAADALLSIAGRPRAPWRIGWRRDEGEAARPPLHGVGLGLLGVRSVPLVAREAERDLLWRELVAVDSDGAARAVLLEGPAGYGKSRLAHWLAERAHELGAAEVLTAKWGPAGGAGLEALLMRDLGCEGLPRPEVQARLKLVLRRLHADDPQERALLTDLLAPPELEDEGGRRPEPIDARTRRALLVAQLRRRATRRPVVLVLDDLQWGFDGLSLLKELLADRGSGRLPVLILGTVQDDALAEQPATRHLLAQIASTPGLTRITIGPLPRSAYDGLIKGLLGLEPGLASRVQRRTIGNPGFALELVSDWIRRGLLELVPGGYRLKSGVEAPMPLGLYETWWRRLERALVDRPDQDVETLEVAATLGLVVDAEEWRAVCRSVDLRASTTLVRHLMEQHLVAAKDGDPGRPWSFAQPMLRAALERRAQEAGRALRWHQECAAVLAERGGPKADERVGLHLLSASLPEDALGPLTRAAARRIANGDFARADELVQGRHDALELLLLEPDDRALVEQSLIEAELLNATGRLPLALAKAERAAGLARAANHHDLLPAALTAQAEALAAQGELAEAHDLLIEALTLAGRAADRGGIARCHRSLALAQLRLGRIPEAADSANAAMNAAQLFDDPVGRAAARLVLAEVLMAEERLPEALNQLEQARRAYNHLMARLGLADSLGLMGALARRQGALDQAEECYRRAHRQLEALGSRDAPMNQARLGFTLSEAARGDEAGAELRAARDAAERGSNMVVVALANVGLLAVTAARDEHAGWVEAFGAVEQLLPAIGLVDHDAALGLTRAAREAWARGWASEAGAVARLALTQWERLGQGDSREVRRLSRLLAAVESSSGA